MWLYGEERSLVFQTMERMNSKYILPRRAIPRGKHGVELLASCINLQPLLMNIAPVSGMGAQSTSSPSNQSRCLFAQRLDSKRVLAHEQ